MTSAIALDAGSSSYYRRLGPQTFQPTLHAQGAWQAHEQHMGPVSGVMLHAVEQHLAAGPSAGRGLQIARITFDILGLIAARPSEITVEVVRPGRTIELVEATMVVDNRPVVRARAWLLSRQDTTEVAGGQPAPLPGPDTMPPCQPTDVWGGGYIHSLQMRLAPGAAPGRVRAWLRTEKTLVEGEQSSDLARFVGLVDTANGIAVRVPPGSWMFPNTDLSIHLHRSPVGDWAGFDTTVVFGSDGVGLTSSILFDLSGPVGRAEQILTVRRL
ncbi:MAG TPA: thioesterase family protein [Propionibacteriaceae bacterium]|nr:thioesterase family protein [Propionibacteriaceae bacterium]